MWFELNRVFQAYERMDPREQIHRRICANFQHDWQIGDPDSFRREQRELLLERGPSLGAPAPSLRVSTAPPRVLTPLPVGVAPSRGGSTLARRIKALSSRARPPV